MSYQVKNIKTSNYNLRGDNARPSYIIMHYIGEYNLQDALTIFCDPKGLDGVKELSPHYVIDEDGTVYALVPEGFRAWHAGVSYWRGITDMNSHSIGIELVNRGAVDDYPPFAQAQIDALAELSKDIMMRNNIPPENVIGHSDIAPGRKLDPGPRFPWRELAKKGVGIWPDLHKSASLVDDFDELKGLGLKELLVKIGYNPDLDLDVLLPAFIDRYHCADDPLSCALAILVRDGV